MSIQVVLKEYVLEHIENSDKIPSTDQEVYNEYKLLPLKVQAQFLNYAQKQLKTKLIEVQKKFKAFERQFQDDMQQADKDEILNIVKNLRQTQPNMTTFQIFQVAWDQHCKKQGLNIDEVKKYVNYCIKQINKHIQVKK